MLVPFILLANPLTPCRRIAFVGAVVLLCGTWVAARPPLFRFASRRLSARLRLGVAAPDSSSVAGSLTFEEEGDAASDGFA